MLKVMKTICKGLRCRVNGVIVSIVTNTNRGLQSLNEQAIDVYMAINSQCTIYALYRTHKVNVHKLISLLTFSVVNKKKSVQSDRPAVCCVVERQCR